MKKFAKKAFYFLACACLLAGCSSGDGVTYHYLQAKRIFDRDVDANAVPADSFTLEEIPGVNFEKRNGVFFAINGKNDLAEIYYSLYVADFNRDGYKDICYGYQAGSYLNYGVLVYDCHNDKVLAKIDDRGTVDYFLTLEGQSLVVLDSQFTGVLSTEHLLNRKGHFAYRDGRIFEILWEYVDYELLSISLSLKESSGSTTKTDTTNPDGQNRPIAYIDRDYALSVILNHNGSNEVNKDYLGNCATFDANPSVTMEFTERHDDYIDYRVRFLETGITDLVAHVGEHSFTLSVDVRS